MNIKKVILKVFTCLICFIFFIYITLIGKVNNSKYENDIASYTVQAIQSDSYIYLSDIDYIANMSSSGWGNIIKDGVNGGGKITVRVENAAYAFDKGIWAHATSTLVYDVSNYNNTYDYFTAYAGVNATATAQGSVKFSVYTSLDGINWELKTTENPQVQTVGMNAISLKVDIKNTKYLKLYADSNGSNGNDHAVYADAKLVKEGYDDNVVSSIDTYDEILKTTYANATLDNKDYELALLQRNFVSKVGRFALKTFLNDPENGARNKETYDWLFNNLDNLKLYMLGGTPDGGNYVNSLTQLARLYEAYKDDFSITDVTKYGTVLGDLYKRMAITLSLTHAQRVALWMQPSAPENQSDAVVRYQIFKDLHKNGKFVVTENIDITKWFESYNVEEMRYVFNNLIDDEEILWLNEYTQSFIDAYPNSAWGYLTPHPYMAYVWPNYSRPEFHDPERRDYWDEKFNGIFSKYNVTYRNGLYKVWMNIRNEFGTGAVCGGISKTGSNIRTSHGIPAVVIGQPGHAAILYYSEDAQGRGYWNIDNDVSGWSLSEKGERLLLGWGNGSYARGFYQVVYTALAQEALNDYDNFVKAEETIMIANTYSNDLEKQEQLYREAINIQPINFDAWYGLINLYLQNENKTEANFYSLAQEVSENLKYFPLPMYNLTNLIKPKLTSIEYSYKFTLLQTRILTEAKSTPNNTEENYYVYQPGITRTEANYLLGILDKTIATFSFNGEDAGKIVLSSRFDGSGVRWDYSLDGKKTWNEVSFTAEEDHKLQLTEEQINSITDSNDIYIHIVGVDYEEENLYKIDITKSEVSAILYNNDLENRIVGVDLTYEWRMNSTDNWTSYAASSPDLTGNKTVEIRVGASGTSLASDSVTYSFTEDNQPNNRKYIPVSHLNIHAVSTEATAHAGQALNAIDGNVNTRYHSAWNGTDDKRFIVIKLDKAVFLSAVDFVPAGGGNGKIYDGTIEGSMDGETWEVLSTSQNWTYSSNDDWANNIKTFEIENPKQVQYVKITANRTNGNWFTARMFNFYQDITKDVHPYAGIAYSTTTTTNNNVTVRLINPSTKINITNNGGSDTYTFTQNGNFTFEFEDASNPELKGSATAKVNWIDKTAPTATIEYSTTNPTNQEVVAVLKPQEEVTVINNEGVQNSTDADNVYMYTFTKNGEFEFRFTDEAGNIGSAIAKVDWIDKTAPTATITYDITELTNKNVTATININENNSRVINNNGSNTYVFTDNGEFEFIFSDQANNVNKITAKVDWITKESPKVSVSYDITTPTKGPVVATINSDLEIKLINSNKSYTFIENGEFEFIYEDMFGNRNKILAKVDWITKESKPNDTKPSTPNEPSKPNDTKPSTPNEPSKPNDTKPSTPNEPSKPSETKPSTPNEPSKPSETKPSTPNEPSKPSEPTKPSTPNEPSKPSEPTKPSEVKPEEPSMTVENIGNYVKYTLSNISVKVSNKEFKKAVNLKVENLKLTSNMENKFSSASEYFKLYFENSKKESVNITSPSQIVISLDPTKQFLGIYEVVNEETRTLQYKVLGDGKIELEVASLGEYLISYNAKEEVTKSNDLHWIVYDLLMVIGIVLLVINLRKKH